MPAAKWADSLSLTRNTPGSCLRRCCSASSLDTGPANHLKENKQVCKLYPPPN
ncbi:hypothetical protein EXN66_Car003549 [Channa argus]|uniref:Uncharacterized protein n=1 Tax=Channa argus TaxID=215402 RepID=A0A6G1PCA3_CHAAH|nr:hypothetical protein EXN66_Car003549 [Channa argus]